MSVLDLRARGVRWLVCGVALLAVVVLIVFYWLPRQTGDKPQASRLDCPQDVVEFVACVRRHMPMRDSPESVRLPDELARRYLSLAAAALAEDSGGGCQVELPPALKGHYLSSELISGKRRYCALWEAYSPQSRTSPFGWGTVIINRTASRRLLFGVPHPHFDLATADQALALFIELDAFAFVMAGSHRYAAPMADCQATAPTDASHNHSGYFALASGLTEVERGRSPDWWFLEWHGMGVPNSDDACYDVRRDRPLDVYLTEGSRQRIIRQGFAEQLVDSLRRRHPDWHIATSGAGIHCDLNGSSNILGRFLNGGAVAADNLTQCASQPTNAVVPTGRFVHIEQLLCPRGLDCQYSNRVRSGRAWQQALVDAYEGTIDDDHR